jgi:hypothetical protein
MLECVDLSPFSHPLYDYGMLDTAKKWLDDILNQMRPAIEARNAIRGAGTKSWRRLSR